MDKESLITQLESTTSHKMVSLEAAVPVTLVIHADDLLTVLNYLQQNPACYFDQLTCITGVDNGPQANTMEVIYHLYSIPFNQSLVLKVVLDRANPIVESIVAVWQSANWLEREVFDMYGIQFKNHPDLRRILMPADWQGFPLRKDYQEQDTYRGIELKAMDNA
jgi:NADH-quinone oxidoreductase subunit C